MIQVAEKPLVEDKLVEKVVELATMKGVAIITNHYTPEELQQTLEVVGATNEKWFPVTMIKLDSLRQEYMDAFKQKMLSTYTNLIIDQRNANNFENELLQACREIQHKVQVHKITGKFVQV